MDHSCVVDSGGNRRICVKPIFVEKNFWKLKMKIYIAIHEHNWEPDYPIAYCSTEERALTAIDGFKKTQDEFSLERSGFFVREEELLE